MELMMAHINEVVSRIDHSVTQLRDVFTVSQIHASATEALEKALEKRDKVLQWLKTTDPSINHEAACKKHQAGTGKWFVDGPCMASWKKQNSMLWLYGIRQYFSNDEAGMKWLTTISGLWENNSEVGASRK
jgi:hypothetical protein